MKKLISIINFKDRYNRKQFIITYFSTFLFLFALSFILPALRQSITSPFITNYLFPIPLFVAILANLSTISKRLHDIGYSSLWILFVFALQISFKNYPPINYSLSAIIILYLCLKKGNEGENKYGKQK